ncbi:sensor domain-containing diguanylate cyclase [Sandarakinorhabdus oryzae]|uniref:sensor domain-containing diguanylate cyclase n=1 Tax=Sandarakinorhabdus oryzae TaxID=2675220 RepID=UPI0012E23655|nr:sensor domain-containing diguanylate cyclase [Sandarakinorhabdus oryzae]
MLAFATEPHLDDEPGRLAALERYAILDTANEPQFDRITALICSALDVPMAAVSFIDKDRQWFKSRQNIAVAETARGIAFCDHTIRQPRAMIVGDSRRDPRFAENPLVTGAPHLLSYAGVPLQTPDGYNVGALCALDTRAREFTRSDIETLANLAAVAVDALEVRSIANYDQLTGAISRRAFLSQLDLAIGRRRARRHLAVLAVCDLDYFKRINDSFGHDGGDAVLRAFGQLCRSLLRKDDFFGRIGGEEFGLLLSDTALDDAIEVVERLRTAVTEMAIPALPGIRITASFGLAGLDPDIGDNAHWMKTADALLYRAKRNGRNRCEHAALPE